MGGFWNAETMRRRLAGDGLVTPFIAEKVVNGAYELSLGSQVYVTSSEAKTAEDLDAGGQISIGPGQFANLLTDEVVTVPPEALGLISVRFRLKQRGLVNVSGFHVDPGYSGHLLFSVFNAGPQPVVIARGEAAFLLWFASFDDQTAPEDLYRGEPRNSITSDDVMRLQGEIANPQALAVRVEDLERWRARAVWVSAAVVGAIIASIVGLFFFPVRDALFEDDSTTTTTTSPAGASSTTSGPVSSQTTGP